VLDLGGREQPREQIGIAKRFRRITVEPWCPPSHLSIAAGTLNAEGNLNDVVSGSVPDELSVLAPSGGTFGGS
jgi:hypothetical protein